MCQKKRIGYTSLPTKVEIRRKIIILTSLDRRILLRKLMRNGAAAILKL